MIPVREIEYQTKESPERSFSRLTWVVERVDRLIGQLLTNHTIDTNRQWVGTLDKETLKFGIIEPSNFWRLNFFQVIVRGKVFEDNGESIVSIKLKLGWYTLIMFLAIYGLTVFMISMIVVDFNLENLSRALIWLLLFPGLGTLFLNRKLNKIERKLDELFDSEQNSSADMESQGLI